MAEGQRLTSGRQPICAAADLAEAGTGVRFEVPVAGEAVSAFAIRYGGEARAYLNRCGHVSVELDWAPGEFFDLSRLYLICSTHGALYDPVSGACAGGPCNGRGLTPLAVEERDGNLYLKD
jgi:nitrite reductase/ring-hydroxylating ferredoxin subunit